MLKIDTIDSHIKTKIIRNESLNIVWIRCSHLGPDSCHQKLPRKYQAYTCDVN